MCLILSAVLTLPLPGFSLEVKADTDKTITGLGTGAITNPAAPTDVNSAWSGSYVYYGKYDTNNDNTAEPVKYRVLDMNSRDFGVTGGSLLLDCDNTLLNKRFDDSSFVWAVSEIKGWLNGENFLGSESNPQGAFTLQERNAIASSTKSTESSNDGSGWSFQDFARLSDEKIFLLDAKEATRTSYGYSNTNNPTANRKKTGSNSWWWLRSPDNRYGVGCVQGGGSVGTIYGLSEAVGVSPAFNVDLSSVIFSSLISGTAGQPGAEYKLTLKDTALSAAPGTITGKGKTVTVPYSGVSGSPTQLSVVMTDGTWSDATGWSSGAELKYYGKLKINDSIGIQGSGTFDLPSDFSLADGWKAYLVAEQVNGGKLTDYAGTPVAFSVPEPEPTPDPTPNPTPNPVPAAEAKTVNLGNLTLNGMTLNIKLYAPRNTVSFNGRTHVWIHENVSGKREKCADLDIAMEGVPDIVAPEFVYGKTKDASEGNAYYYLRLKPDAASASYNALGEDVKKKLGKEIKKVNKALKKKANRVYFSIDRLDLGEFAYDASKSGARKKVFVRKDGSGDTLTLHVKTKKKIDPMTWTVKSSRTTVLDATLSGYSFRIPKREYKKAPGGVAITGKMKNLAGSTV